MGTLRNPCPPLVTEKAIRAAYDYLAQSAFRGVRLPRSGRVKFVAKRLKKYHGLFEWPDLKMTIDVSTNNGTCLLQHVAHEMCHLALERSGRCDHDKHDRNFEALAEIICFEMGWPKDSV